jgi:hypothetical protein
MSLLHLYLLLLGSFIYLLVDRFSLCCSWAVLTDILSSAWSSSSKRTGSSMQRFHYLLALEPVLLPLIIFRYKHSIMLGTYCTSSDVSRELMSVSGYSSLMTFPHPFHAVFLSMPRANFRSHDNEYCALLINPSGLSITLYVLLLNAFVF